MAGVRTTTHTSLALLQQKNEKTVGPDGLPAEVIKNQVCCTFFQSLFSACLKNLIIPTVWHHGIITPIPKNKTSDPRIPLNYRGISLLSVPYKAFCSILNQYILEWIEYTGILCEEQNGFRVGRSCLEHIFSLSSIIECRKKLKNQHLLALWTSVKLMVMSNMVYYGRNCKT